jgi:transcriptional antiterminator RfaH
MLKISENPAMLTPRVQSLSELEGNWWIAYTKARFEKALAWDVLNHGIDYFLPMREKVIFSGARKRRIMLPLFTSYVFLCGTEGNRYTAMKTNRICHTIQVKDQERFINELVSVEKALFNNIIIDNYNSLPVGTYCRINSGPMMGIEGKVIERLDLKARMVLEVTLLGQGALIEIDSDLLEKTS